MRKNHQLYILMGLMLITTTIVAQDRTIEGTITDAESEPLIGVNVIVKGTVTGTITDGNGAYRLTIPSDMNVIVYSYVGFIVQEIDASNRTIVDVQLELDLEILSEVVIVGYTEKDQKKLTSSIAIVEGDKIARVPMATFDNILQGTAPGLLVQSGTGQPGRSARFVIIRGIKSINSSSTPLYILDGIEITGGDFVAINPNDISSVSILKDAAATQIYGSRGATGVIVLTTKSGVRGKTKIEYHALFGVSPRPEYNDGLRPLTSSQLIDLQHEIGIGATVGLPQ